MISFSAECSILWPCARFLQNKVLESLTGKSGRKAIYFSGSQKGEYESSRNRKKLQEGVSL